MPLHTETKRGGDGDVLAEERARGCKAELPGSWAKEKEHGCDILSTPAGADGPHAVEVKAWGEPLLTTKSQPERPARTPSASTAFGLASGIREASEP